MTRNRRPDSPAITAGWFCRATRRVLRQLIASRLLVACASVPANAGAYGWEDHLRGDAIVLLGEIHDNAQQHRLRLEILRRALAAGWRPAIAMEQFDREHQADMDKAREARPLDPDYFIDQGAPEHATARSGWDWQYYRPYVQLALQYRLPLLAANLSDADAAHVFARGYSSVFDDQAAESLGLRAVPDARIAAQEQEIEVGHCHAMPEAQLPAMARAQLARDAVMAAVLREQAPHGVVLLAGDGHVRRDIGVASWLPAKFTPKVFAVGFVERGDSPPPAGAFDTVVVTSRAARADPCAALRRDLRKKK
jgi:uncharacterized iron-regulated protein